MRVLLHDTNLQTCEKDPSFDLVNLSSEYTADNEVGVEDLSYGCKPPHNASAAQQVVPAYKQHSRRAVAASFWESSRPSFAGSCTMLSLFRVLETPEGKMARGKTCWMHPEKPRPDSPGTLVSTRV